MVLVHTVEGETVAVADITLGKEGRVRGKRAENSRLEGGAILETLLSETMKTRVLMDIIGPVVAKVGISISTLTIVNVFLNGPFNYHH